MAQETPIVPAETGLFVQRAVAERARVAEFQRKHRIQVLTMLFTDIVGSTKLKQQLGDKKAIALLTRHHNIIRETLTRFAEAEEIETAGDSFFCVFAKPSDAAHFALLVQRRTRELARESGIPVLDRIGIHVGEVFIHERGEAERDLFGIQIDTAARVMSLGEGDQILLSRFAFDNARQVLRGHEMEGLGDLSWLNHGFYQMKSVEEPEKLHLKRKKCGKPITVRRARSHRSRWTRSVTSAANRWRFA
jgi:class 3 adenylate cyclase